MVLLVLAILAGMNVTQAQPAIIWQQSYGGTLADLPQSINPTPDGGYIVAGFTTSNNGDITNHHGNDDYWVTKLTSTGSLEWQKCLGGSDFDQAYAVLATPDSGYVIAGFSSSTDGDITNPHGGDDYWVVKLDQSGNLQWQKSYGGTNWDDALNIRQTADGGYILTGDTQSNNGDVTGHHGAYDAWIVKLDSAGNLQWQKCLGGTSDDTATSIEQTLDGGYIVGGSTRSNNGDVTGNHGSWDYWVVKLNDTAGIEWQKCLGGTGEDVGYSIVQLPDSSYTIAGFTRSNNGDVSGLHGGGTQPDWWVVKLTATGTMEWQKCLGGISDDKCYSLRQTHDQGYILAGYAKSNDGDVSGNHATGFHDEWIVKLDVAGTIQWQKCLGGSDTDWARAIRQTPDSSYIIAGFSSSTDGDITNPHGGNDFWIVKLDHIVPAAEPTQLPWQLYPNPTSGIFHIAGNPSMQNAAVKILNPLGQTVFQGAMEDNNLFVDLSSCESGIYFVTITSGEERWERKVMIGR